MIASGTLDVEAMRKYNQRLAKALDNLKMASIEAKKSRDVDEAHLQDLMRQIAEVAAAITEKKE